MSSYKVHIVFTDGTEEIIDRVEKARVTESLLILENRRPITYDTEHVGSYPLANIKKWKFEENW
jgi:hypothetical protein